MYGTVIKHFFLPYFKKPIFKLILWKHTFFKIILPTFLYFRIANRNFSYYCQYFDKKLKCPFSSCIGLEWCCMTNMMIGELIEPLKLNESVVAITNTSCVYLLTWVWMFCFLKVQKLNLLTTMALNYTKATRSRVGLVSCPF